MVPQGGGTTADEVHAPLPLIIAEECAEPTAVDVAQDVVQVAAQVNHSNPFNEYIDLTRTLMNNKNTASHFVLKGKSDVHCTYQTFWNVFLICELKSTLGELIFEQ